MSLVAERRRLLSSSSPDEALRGISASRGAVTMTVPTLASRSAGSPERDFIYGEDAVDAYLAICTGLDDEKNHGEAFNAGAGRPWPVLEIVNTLLEVSGSDLEPDIQGSGTPTGEIDRQYLDSTLIGERLGWSAQWSLRDGLAETIGWYQRVLPALTAG